MMLEQRIYYGDTDAEGVVYYANYLRFLEIARVEFLRDRGISVEEFDRKGFIFVVTGVNIEYHASACYGDVIQIQSFISNLKHASLIFNHYIFNKDTQAKLVSAQVKIAYLNKQHKPLPFPRELKAILAAE